MFKELMVGLPVSREGLATHVLVSGSSADHRRRVIFGLVGQLVDADFTGSKITSSADFDIDMFFKKASKTKKPSFVVFTDVNGIDGGVLKSLLTRSRALNVVVIVAVPDVSLIPEWVFNNTNVQVQLKDRGSMQVLVHTS